MQKSDFRTRIRLLILNLNITQKEFATLTGCRESSISNYVVGVSTPNQKTLNKIATATKVDPSWLMGYGSDDDIPILQ